MQVNLRNHSRGFGRYLANLATTSVEGNRCKNNNSENGLSTDPALAGFFIPYSFPATCRQISKRVVVVDRHRSRSPGLVKTTLFFPHFISSFPRAAGILARRILIRLCNYPVTAFNFITPPCSGASLASTCSTIPHSTSSSSA